MKVSFRPALSGDVPRGYALSSITSLTYTHFDPTIFLNFRKNVVVSHRVNEPIYLVHGTSFRVRLEKGNTGGHGASQGQENCGERAEGNNSRINSSVCLKMMEGFYLHRFVPGSFSEESLEMA